MNEIWHQAIFRCKWLLLFKVGDLVRISKAKKTFEKGYLPNWTTELFTISKIIPDRYPYVYKIQDYNGEEL